MTTKKATSIYFFNLADLKDERQQPLKRFCGWAYPSGNGTVRRGDESQMNVINAG